MPLAKLKEVEINYHVVGDGMPILFISGFGVDHRVWLPQVNFFKERYKVIVFDNRGIGGSKAPKRFFTIEDMAVDCASLLEHLNIESSHVVGSSMGGMIAQELAIRYPDKVDKLALCSTAAKLDRKVGRNLIEGFRKVMKEGVDDIVDADASIFERIFNYVMQLAFSKEFLKENKDFINFLILEYTSKKNYPDILLRQLRAIMKHDATKRLKNLKTKTLIITGECDNVIPPICSDTLHKLIVNSKLVKIPCGTHGIHLERAEEFNREILNFLEE